MTWVLAAVCGIASVPAGLRWLRIGQREHYLPPSAMRFAWRWWSSGLANVLLLFLGIVGVLGSLWSVWFGFLVALAQIGPLGLSIKGVSSPLAWTDRLKRLAYLTTGIVFLFYLLGGLAKTPFLVVLGLFALPAIVDLSMWILAPVEKMMGNKWVRRAAARLNSVDAEVVAITGSYGKTTTKNYVSHLLTGSRRTVASPASFNNRMGLAKAVNEGLTPGTEVFVAEMGTYGPGEIAKLTKWIKPKVAAIVAIGPVHLERFGTEKTIVDSKAEILDEAEIGVICVDHPFLADLARRLSESMEILTVSTAEDQIRVGDEVVAPVPKGAFPANVAVAVGIGVALGIPLENLLPRLSDLPVAEHRQSVSTSEAGFTIIDDTFNSNPAGAARGLDLLDELGKRTTVVVTPGMIELGEVQEAANREFATMASGMVDQIVIVGRTNLKALLEGSGNGDASVSVVATREEAVTWVRSNLGPGDAVLYENDLPDHYP
jgi:UDP-N-acetylmuramoyl-tripeptide--D-alanyl-D-alanine ligase